MTRDEHVAAVEYDSGPALHESSLGAGGGGDGGAPAWQGMCRGRQGVQDSMHCNRVHRYLCVIDLSLLMLMAILKPLLLLLI